MDEDEKQTALTRLNEAVMSLNGQQADLAAKIEQFLIEQSMGGSEVKDLIDFVRDDIGMHHGLIAVMQRNVGDAGLKVDEPSQERKMDDTTQVLLRISELSNKIETESRIHSSNLESANKQWATEMKSLSEQTSKNLESQLKVISSAIDAGDKIAGNRSESAEKLAGLAISGQTAIKLAFITVAVALFAFVYNSSDSLHKDVGAFKTEVNQRFDKMDQKLDLLISKKR